MMLECNGRRLGRRVQAEMLAAIGQTELGQLMQAQGYALRPMRAPRSLAHGEVVIRATWWKAEANATITVRSTIRLRGLALA